MRRAMPWLWITRIAVGMLLLVSLATSAGLRPVPLIGVTSLAIGADQLFADAVLQLGGELEAVIPFAEYDRTFDNSSDLRNCVWFIR